ncbi:hydroxymethylglutaryl-CoA lyase [Cognatishimia sp. F0-27]|uniref:hydroxymethylglutaryl-CoA lyase n=1 Tax=Cognatishimia sp. F0-27 TaxID=2816855 RepID=UPI001D0CA2AE|nr:hydroxymethylglutaryl-CoA lyase [Cognatishimia sp. F0-27]MCC1493476.1 hydroxymethylglutaryl-CoA lyase [Cognatishimia sp. F0-27]
MATNFCEIIEVSPRDGIQNEKTILSTAQKLSLITRARDAGLRRAEVTSFVNPKRVPQMADAADVAAGLPPGIRSIGLTLNKRGFDRAVDAGLDEANFVVVASETFNQKNQGTGTFDSVAAFGAVSADAPDGIGLGLTIGAAFGCPFEGDVSVARLMAVVEAVMAHDPHELALADTIGVATPRDVTERVAAVRAAFPDVPLRLHLHNTRNTGIANAWAGLDAGVRRLDASLGGTGGCPFAPRATGNIATEDLVYMLDRSGVETGVDLDAAIRAAEWLEDALGHPVPGQVMKAGGFPSPQAA